MNILGLGKDALKAKPHAGVVAWPSVEEAVPATAGPVGYNESPLKRGLGQPEKIVQVKKSRITTALVARGSSARAGPVIQAAKMRKVGVAGKKPVARSIALAEESSGGGVRSMVVHLS